MKRVSVVIPIYNREKLLLRTLRSVALQTYRPLEIILVDNGSTDSSLEVCREFCCKNKGDGLTITCIQEHRKGANRARNRGLEAASGEYISFYDSDDEMLPDRIETAVRELEQGELDVVFFPSFLCLENEICHVKKTRYTLYPEDQILMSSIATQNMIGSTLFIKEIGGWNEQLQRWQDWELGVRILISQPRARWIKNRAFDKVHIHSESITGTGFSHSYPFLLEAIHCVYQTLTRHKKEQTRALRMLYFRQIQLAALCHKEGNKDLATQTLKDAIGRYPITSLQKIICKILYCYISIGGRGAWKVARLLF